MALSAFDDRSKQPRASDLKRTLRRASTHWDNLISYVASAYPPLDETWSFSGAAWGWSLRLRQKKRTVLYMTPGEGHFLVGLVLGEKAVKAARASALPGSVRTLIARARKYAEGRAVRIAVSSKRDLEIAKQLAAIKMAN